MSKNMQYMGDDVNRQKHCMNGVYTRRINFIDVHVLPYVWGIQQVWVKSSSPDEEKHGNHLLQLHSSWYSIEIGYWNWMQKRIHSGQTGVKGTYFGKGFNDWVNNI